MLCRVVAPCQLIACSWSLGNALFVFKPEYSVCTWSNSYQYFIEHELCPIWILFCWMLFLNECEETLYEILDNANQSDIDIETNSCFWFVEYPWHKKELSGGVFFSFCFFFFVAFCFIKSTFSPILSMKTIWWNLKKKPRDF